MEKAEEGYIGNKGELMRDIIEDRMPPPGEETLIISSVNEEKKGNICLNMI